MMPLTLADIGTENTIRRVGGNEETRRFLENLGFVTGTPITVLSSIGGNVIVKVGSTVVVTKIDGDGAYKRRIMDMGITKGTELYIRKVAPLGDPVEITVRGYELSVRKEDAKCVQVK